MKSIILCEGKDDLWFIAYYLHKTGGWLPDKKNLRNSWRNYRIEVKDNWQNVEYITNESGDYVAIKAVGGQDRMKTELEDICYINRSHPQDAIETIVLVKDCDTRPHQIVIDEMSAWFEESISLENHTISTYRMTIGDYVVPIQILPIVVPFDRKGAIETVLLQALKEKGNEEAFIVDCASNFVNDLFESRKLTKYLTHGRQITKAEYSAAIAITNPDHSTELFKEMALASEWEKTDAIRNHYGCILNAITSPWSKPL